MATRRNSGPKLDDKGRMVFRFDKMRDGSQPTFMSVREGDAKHALLFTDDGVLRPGWEQVDPEDRDAANREAAEKRFGVATEARDAEQEMLNRRHGVVDTTEGRQAGGRGRPSNAEKVAVARAESAEARVAELEAALAAKENADDDGKETDA